MRVQRLTLLFCSLFLLICTDAQQASAEEPAGVRKAPPLCALIDLDKSPLGSLLESELITRADTNWLERSEIEKVRSEQNLQSFFTADATKDRISLGKTLKADLLVVLRMGEREKQRYAEIVVAETDTGLRFVARQVPLGEDPEADAATLAKLVDQGLSKAGEKITHIFAVPPLINQDLTFEYDYLKAAYARAVEHTLLETPGVLVVELTEAEALVREFELVEAEAKVRRPLPVYLLGEFRNQGRDENRQVKLTLRFQQGTKELESFEKILPPSAVAGYLQERARAVVQGKGSPATPADPAVEAKQLASRAASFIQLANWSEALPLIEASLMLDPDQPELRGKAIESAMHLAKGRDLETIEGATQALLMNNRAVAHQRILVMHYPLEYARPYLNLLLFSSFRYLKEHDEWSGLSPELLSLREQCRQDTRGVMTLLAHRYAEAGDWNISAFCLNQAIEQLPPTERYAERIKMTLKYQDLPDVAARIQLFAHRGTQGGSLKTIEGRQFLRQLRDAPGASMEVQAAAAEILATVNIDQTPSEIVAVSGGIRQNTDPQRPADKPKVSRLTFRPVDLSLKDRGSRGKFDNLETCIPLSNGDDLFWDRLLGVYTRSSQGDLKYLWRPQTGHIDSLRYDGRYLWSTVYQHQETCELWVIDTVSRKYWQIKPEDGLPMVSRSEMPIGAQVLPQLRLSPIGEGKAIVAGHIGRLWLAEVTFDPQGSHQVRVFHEGKETVPPHNQPIDWKNPHLASPPGRLITFSETQENRVNRQWVLMTRLSHGLGQYPLIVDLADDSVQVLESGLSLPYRAGEPENFVDGALYYTQTALPNIDTMNLLRFGVPDFKSTTVIPSLPEGYVAFDTNEATVNVFGQNWLRGKLTDESLESYGPVPWAYRNRRAPFSPADRGPAQLEELQLQLVMNTNQFGLVVKCANRRNATVLAQVLFDGSGMSLSEVLQLQNSGDDRARWNQLRTAPRPEVLEEELKQGEGSITGFALSPDGTLLITTRFGAQPNVQAWDFKTRQLLANLRADSADFTKVVFSRSGRHFATGSRKGTVLVWDTVGLKPVQELKGPPGEIRKLAFSWNEQQLAALGAFSTTLLWEISSGKEVHRFEHRQVMGAWIGFSPDDQRLFISDPRRTQAWDVKTGISLGGIESLNEVVGYVPDGKLLATNNDLDRSLIRWDNQSESYDKLWEQTSGTLVAVSPDGRRCATHLRYAFIDNQQKEINRLQVWDIATQKLLLSEDGFLQPRWEFSPDGEVIFGTSMTRGLQWRQITPFSK